MHRIKKTDNAKAFPLVAGFCVAAVLCMYVLIATLNYEPDFSFTVIGVTLGIFLCWSFFLMRSLFVGRLKVNKRLWVFVVLFLLLGVGLVSYCWDNTYAYGNLVDKLATAPVHGDVLFHSTFSQAYANYGYPSMLSGSADPFYYHTLSHLFTALLAKIFSLQPIVINNYLYQLFLMPLYVYFFYAAIIQLRTFLRQPYALSVSDIVISLCFFIPFAPSAVLGGTALFQRSMIVSQSFLTANTLLLVYGTVVLRWINTKKHTKKLQKPVYWKALFFVVNPLAIILIANAKISVGFLLCAGIGYSLLRLYTKQLKYWLLNILYVVVFFCGAVWPAMANQSEYLTSSKSMQTVQLFSAIINYVDKEYVLLHFLLFFGLATITVYFGIFRCKSVKTIVTSRSYLFYELVVVLCFGGYLPGMLFAIPGGSAFYFSLVGIILGMVGFLGLNIPNRAKAFLVRAGFGRFLPYCLTAFILASVLLYTPKYVDSFTSVVKSRFANSVAYSSGIREEIDQQFKSGDVFGAAGRALYVTFQPTVNARHRFYLNLQEINAIVDGNPKDYYIFADETSEMLLRYYNTGYAQRFFYPATTGVVAIGLHYTENGVGYFLNGSPDYSFVHTGDIEKMTLSAAVQQAKTDGKKYLIHVYGDTYEVIQV